METSPLKKEHQLELENLSLKVHILKRNLQELQDTFQKVTLGIFEAEGKKTEEWSIDIDNGTFVKKNS